jgi:uncharacterized protein (DUF302 family)
MPKGGQVLNNPFVMLSAGVVAGVLAALVAVVLAAPRLMVVEDRSELPVDETVARIVATAEARGWKVPAVHQLDVSVRNAGQDVLPATVVELCRPDLAGRILREDAPRIVTSLMPCRVAVYRTSAGEVFVSRMNTMLLARLFGGLVTRVMTEASSDSEEILAAALGTA